MYILNLKTTILACAIVCCSLSGAWASEDNRQLPDSNAQVVLSYAPLVKRAAPAVVNIYTQKTVQQRIFSPFLDDPMFQRFFGFNGNSERVLGGVTRKRIEQSLGSGVIVRADGLIVTSNHVIAGADEITVALADRREFPAKLLTTDKGSDLAVLRIVPPSSVHGNKPALPWLELKDSDDIEVGDMVLAIGNPFGVGQTVTSGIISATSRTSTDINDLNYFLQTDAAINPGNSGGALVTMDGKLAGINAAIFSNSGGSLGIGFAVPSNMVRAVIVATDEGRKRAARPWTGISGQEVTADMAEALGLERPTGMLVKAMHPASPAGKAGLKVGDVVTAVNGREVDDPAAFRYRIATLPLNTPVTLGVRRADGQATVVMSAIAAPAVPPRETTTLKGRNPFAGATIVNLSPAVVEELELPDMGLDDRVSSGVVVTAVAKGSAAETRLAEGDIILGVNGRRVATVSEVKDNLQAVNHLWKIAVLRDGRVINLIVGE